MLSDHVKNMHKENHKCNICDNSYDKRWKLEKHLNEHDAAKEFKCDQCDSEFFLKWRLERHVEGHSRTNRKGCHYFNNGKVCPYSDIGCKFRHEMTDKCMNNKFCRILHCQYRHDELDNKLSETQKSVEEFDMFEEGISSNSTAIKDNDALIKLRKDLKDAIEKTRALNNYNEQKELFISITLAENDSLKQNIEALEKRIKMKRKALSQ